MHWAIDLILDNFDSKCLLLLSLHPELLFSAPPSSCIVLMSLIKPIYILMHQSQILIIAINMVFSL